MAPILGAVGVSTTSLLADLATIPFRRALTGVTASAWDITITGAFGVATLDLAVGLAAVRVSAATLLPQCGTAPLRGHRVRIATLSLVRTLHTLVVAGGRGGRHGSTASRGSAIDIGVLDTFQGDVA